MIWRRCPLACLPADPHAHRRRRRRLPQGYPAAGFQQGQPQGYNYIQQPASGYPGGGAPAPAPAYGAPSGYPGSQQQQGGYPGAPQPYPGQGYPQQGYPQQAPGGYPPQAAGGPYNPYAAPQMQQGPPGMPYAPPGQQAMTGGGAAGGAVGCCAACVGACAACCMLDACCDLIVSRGKRASVRVCTLRGKGDMLLRGVRRNCVCTPLGSRCLTLACPAVASYLLTRS